MALTSQITTSLLQVDGRLTEGGVIEIVPGARLLLDVGVEDVEPGALLDEIATAVAEAQAARDEAVDISGISTSDAVIASRITTPGTATETALSAKVEAGALPRTGASAQITGPFYWRGGAGNTPITAKPLGDGKGGVFDITNDDTTGYLFHTHSGANSGAASYHYGGGADQGAGGVFLFAAKNAGKGLSGTSHPSHTGTGVDFTFYSSTASSFVVRLHPGAGGMVVQQRTGKGYGDGVTTLGSTTFTSATAAFTGGDVGQAISQLTSRGEAYGIDTGTTIASVTNATTVVLSKPAIASSTGINFLVAGRAVPTGQKFVSYFNSADSELFYIANNATRVNVPFEVAAAATGNVNSTWTAGSIQKYYAWDGTAYTASQVNVDAFGLRLEHFVSAAKGTESGSVRSLIGRNVGGVPYIGFLGASAVARQVVGAAATDAATTQTLANNLRTALINLGLASA